VIEAIENHWANHDKATAPEKTAALPPYIKRGKGIATTWYGIGKTGLLNLSRCNVEILDDGTLLVKEGASDIGQGSNTVMALLAAKEMGLTLDKVKVIAADSCSLLTLT
jgi:CO/xanthine dehydrogenase Mo-binding subunit